MKMIVVVFFVFVVVACAVVAACATPTAAEQSAAADAAAARAKDRAACEKMCWMAGTVERTPDDVSRCQDKCPAE